MKSPVSGANVEVNWCGLGHDLGRVATISPKADWHFVREPDGTTFVASEAYCSATFREPLPETLATDLLAKAREANNDGMNLVFLTRRDIPVYESFGLDPKVGSHKVFYLA